MKSKYAFPWTWMPEGFNGSPHGRWVFNAWCGNWPYFWPLWTGGLEDFRDNRGQPFQELIELREATMLEF